MLISSTLFFQRTKIRLKFQDYTKPLQSHYNTVQAFLIIALLTFKLVNADLSKAENGQIFDIVTVLAFFNENATLHFVVSLPIARTVTLPIKKNRAFEYGLLTFKL